MAKTLEQLLSLSTIIANETKAGANTALRVGGLFSDIIYYLRDLDYADKDDIPSLEGYATEQWVLGKGYATTSDLDTRIDALVNGAPQAYDTLKEIADVLAGNVNSISDILTALGNKADKATTLSGYGITDAYTIEQIDRIVNGLSGDISTLEGYFIDGVANSALRLSDNGSYTAWGQTFFTNGKPKSLSGALTDVTDITSSGTIITNKIVIGNGTIEWDEANKGFKIVGGLYTESYLSAKGANTNGGTTPSGNQYTRLDTWDGYTTAMDGWVLSAKLGKGLYDTQNSLISRVGALEGKATNVSFTQSLTSGTQIGTITIDGAAKNIYAPTIPTSDINKGVTAYGWGNHATMGYITASASITGNAASASLIKPTTGTGVASSWVSLTSYTKVWGEAFNVSSLGSDTGDIALYLRSGVYTKNSAELCVAIDGDFYAQTGSKKVLHEGNYTDYTYSKTTIDSTLSGYQTKITSSNKLAYSLISGTPTSLPASDVYAWAKAATKPSYAFSEITNKPTTLSGFGITDAYTKSQVDSALGGYLPLSGGTISSATLAPLNVQRSASGAAVIAYSGESGTYGFIGFNDTTTPKWWNTSYQEYTLIHSGNIGSQSVASAKGLVTDAGNSIVHVSGSTFYIGDSIYTEKSTHILGSDVRLRYGASATTGLVLNSSGNVGIGTTSPQYKLDVNGTFGARGTAYCTLPSASADAFYYTERTDLGKTIGFGIGTSNNRGIYDNKLGWIFKVDTSDAISIGGGYAVSFGGNVNCNAVVYGKVGVYSDGYVSAKGQNTSSDMRLKNVLGDVVLGVKDIANAPSVRFAWKNGGGVDVGSSAQYWQKLLPDAVKERDGMLEMQYANIALLSAIALAKNFETHEERIARLEKENEELRNEINSLRYGA